MVDILNPDTVLQTIIVLACYHRFVMNKIEARLEKNIYYMDQEKQDKHLESTITKMESNLNKRLDTIEAGLNDMRNHMLDCKGGNKNG